MSGAGYPSGAIRFICHLLFGYYGWNSLSLYNKMWIHDELFHAPYPDGMVSTQHMVAAVGLFAFWWNFVMWIPTIIAQGIFVAVLGAVDLMIAVWLIVNTVLATTYTPTSKSPCQHASTWGVPAGNASVFEVILNHHARPGKVKEECSHFVDIWSIGIALSVFYLFSAGFNIVGGLLSRKDYHDWWC